VASTEDDYVNEIVDEEFISIKLESSIPIEIHWSSAAIYVFIKEFTVELNLKMVETF
jgi:hypothetical protein